MAPFRFDVEGSIIEVPVWWVDKPPADYKWDYSKGSLPKTHFRARHEPSGFDRFDTDINNLRDAAEKTIREWYKVEWAPFIRVTVGSSGGDRSTSVDFKYEFFAVGERPDGKTLHMNIPEPEDRDERGFGTGKGKWSGKWDLEFARYSGSNVREGLPETGKSKEQWRSEETVASLIPCTPENIAAVRRFEKALEALADEMRRRFMPDRIGDTMKILLEGARIPILPAKTKEEDDT